MELTDIAPLETWKQLEKEIYEKSGLNASVYNTEGARITDFVNWVNPLCPEIKANQKGQTFICSLAHQNISKVAQESKKPVIDECDAGFVKVAVPIFVNDEYIGVAGGCGLLAEDGEIDTFYVQKTIGGDEENWVVLSENVKVLSNDSLGQLTAFIEEKLSIIVGSAQVKN